MKTVVVLAMHGSPAKDIPRMQVVLDVGLHMAMEHGPRWLRRVLEGYYSRIDAKIRSWPRTPENAPSTPHPCRWQRRYSRIRASTSWSGSTSSVRPRLRRRWSRPWLRRLTGWSLSLR